MTLDLEFCVRSLRCALAGGRSEIFNTDQGSRYTSNDYTGILHDSNIRILNSRQIIPTPVSARQMLCKFLSAV